MQTVHLDISVLVSGSHLATNHNLATNFTGSCCICFLSPRARRREDWPVWARRRDSAVLRHITVWTICHFYLMASYRIASSSLAHTLLCAVGLLFAHPYQANPCTWSQYRHIACDTRTVKLWQTIFLHNCLRIVNSALVISQRHPSTDLYTYPNWKLKILIVISNINHFGMYLKLQLTKT